MLARPDRQRESVGLSIKGLCAKEGSYAAGRCPQKVNATAPFYGGAMTRAGGTGGKAPIDDAANLKGPVLALLAARMPSSR